MSRPRATLFAWSPDHYYRRAGYLRHCRGDPRVPEFFPKDVTVPLWGIVLMSLLASTFSATGALIASRSASNWVAWLLVGIGLTMGLTLAQMAYVETSLPGRRWAVWGNQWVCP
jgi:hypothetical protein